MRADRTKCECIGKKVTLVIKCRMRLDVTNTSRLIGIFLLLTPALLGQTKRLWVLQPSGELVEYDPTSFATRQTVKVPGQSPQNIEVNRSGQILYATTVTLPLVEGDVASAGKVWFWNGKTAATINSGVKREVATTGSNQAVTESAPAAYLSVDGAHLYWFANQARRLQREGIDLSVSTSWKAWRTDLSGEKSEEVASLKLPDCRCTTGSCEDTCSSEAVWAPESGLGNFFITTEFLAGKAETVYKASTRYQEEGTRWTAIPLTEPLRRVLDTDASGQVIVEAIPDTGCCGWANQSDDQTRVLNHGKVIPVFDELATYQNPDYDVSFFTSNARLSAGLQAVAMTISATAQANQAIQLSEQGQANPEESKAIRKALAELPAVEVKSVDETPRRVAFIPHAALVGWLSDKEVLIVEDHLLVVYNIATSARRRSSVRVEDAAHIFLR